jgi:hypothetical protein
MSELSVQRYLVQNQKQKAYKHSNSHKMSFFKYLQMYLNKYRAPSLTFMQLLNFLPNLNVESDSIEFKQ